MTGIIWACAATFIAACVPILAKVGTKKTDPALAGSIAGIVLCASIFFYRKDNIMGSSLTALGQRSVIFILLAGLATGLFGICFFKFPVHTKGGKMNSRQYNFMKSGSGKLFCFG